MERKDVKLEEVSPMMREYLKTKSEYEGIILFYRLGSAFNTSIFRSGLLCK